MKEQIENILVEFGSRFYQKEPNGKVSFTKRDLECCTQQIIDLFPNVKNEEDNQNYILLRDLPDANRGTKIILEEGKKFYFYYKMESVPPHDKNYLTFDQVTKSPEWFKKENEDIIYNYSENSLFSKEEVFDVLKEVFSGNGSLPEKRLHGLNELITNKRLSEFKEKLIDLGNNKLKKHSCKCKQYDGDTFTQYCGDNCRNSE